MPFYNAPAELTAAALESVLAQGVAGLEVVVVDDGSSSEAAAALARTAEAFRGRLDLKVLRQENAGPGAARNRAVEAASHELLAQLDADDRWLPGKLARQLEVLRAEPDTWMVFGAMTVEDEAGRVLRRRTGSRRAEVFGLGPGRQYLALLENNLVNNSTACFRRQGYREIGGYDPAFRNSGDTDLWLRACRRGLRLRYLDVPMAVQVYHGGNVSWQRDKRRRAWVRLLQRELGDPPGVLADVPAGLVRRARAAAWLKLGRYARHLGEPGLARTAFARSFALRPSLAAAGRWVQALASPAPSAGEGRGKG